MDLLGLLLCLAMRQSEASVRAFLPNWLYWELLFHILWQQYLVAALHELELNLW